MGETEAQPAQDVYGEATQSGRVFYTATGSDWDSLADDESATEEDSLRLLNALVESPLPTRRQIVAVASCLVVVGLLSLLTSPWEMSRTRLWLYLGGLALIIGSLVWLMRVFRQSVKYGQTLRATAFQLRSRLDESTLPVVWEVLDDAVSILSAHKLITDALELRLEIDAAKRELASERSVQITIPAQRSAVDVTPASERSAP